MANLRAEFQYYLDHQSELVAKYNGKFVVIKGGQIVGVFGDLSTAVNETVKTHELGTFLVQKVEPGETAYSQVFHSRVAFS